MIKMTRTVALLLLSCLLSCKKSPPSSGPHKVNISMVHLLSLSPDVGAKAWRDNSHAYMPGFWLSDPDIRIAGGTTVTAAKPGEGLPLPAHFGTYADIDLDAEGRKLFSLYLCAAGNDMVHADDRSIVMIDTIQFYFTDAQFLQQPASVILKKRSSEVELALYWY